MKRIIGLVVLGIAGLAAAIALTVGALALAGGDVGSVVQPTLVPSDSGDNSGSGSSGSGSSGSGSGSSGSGSGDSHDDD